LLNGFRNTQFTDSNTQNHTKDQNIKKFISTIKDRRKTKLNLLNNIEDPPPPNTKLTLLKHSGDYMYHIFQQ
jgi:hypothetical protein